MYFRHDSNDTAAVVQLKAQVLLLLKVYVNPLLAENYYPWGVERKKKSKMSFLSFNHSDRKQQRFFLQTKFQPQSLHHK